MQTTDRLHTILKMCTYPDLEFQLDCSERGPRLRVHCPRGVDNVTGAVIKWNGRWWSLSYHMVDGEIVQTAFEAVKQALIHEACERFKFCDIAVYDRHLDVYELARLSRDGAVEKRKLNQIANAS